MTIVLFTEDGPTGEAISILARRILSTTGKNVKVKRRQVNRGDIFKNPRKLAAFINLAQQKEKSRIIVCVDSECTPSAVTEQNLKPCKDHVQKVKLAAHFIVVVHALETWLAADPNALRSAFSIKSEVKVPGHLESECRPADMLARLIKKHGFEFIKSRDDVKIAGYADPKLLAQRCSSFAQFQKILLAK